MVTPKRSLTCAAVTALLVSLPHTQSTDARNGSVAVARVYSDRADDPWNRIFTLLFSRRIKARKSAKFADARPFMDLQAYPFPPPLRVSTRVFDSLEAGDRAVDAFYPTFMTGAGLRSRLADGRDEQLSRALIEALEERAERGSVARVLMQADLWSAFDALAEWTNAEGRLDADVIKGHAERLMPLLARLIRKVALPARTIALLPDNYASARREHGLPDVFGPASGWIEVVYSDFRAHDRESSACRRASRVFVKPAAPPADPQRFVEGLRDVTTSTRSVAAAALLMQMLAIDDQGQVVPTPLIFDVQTRSYLRPAVRGATTELHQYELSRRRLLAAAPDDGLTALDENSPVYLPTAGNDFGFATPLRDFHGKGEPLLVPLRQRCSACHGVQAAALMTFSLKLDYSKPLPPVFRLSQPNDRHARDIAARKMARGDFERLMSLWEQR